MLNDDKWVFSSSGNHMLVSFGVDFNSGPGFHAKIHKGKKINTIKIMYSLVPQHKNYFQSIVQM